MFRGCYVALVTPMTERGEVDFPSLQNLITYQVEQGVTGLVILGTSGEAVTISEDEQHKVISCAIETIANRCHIILGCSGNNTNDVVKQAKRYSEYPIDGLLSVAPYYNKPTQRGMIAHFTAIAEASSKPVILYNVPGRTVSDILPDTVAVLSQHPNIVGIKEATGDLSRVTLIREACGENFALLSGDDASSCEFMLLGGDGVISVTGNVLPAQIAELCEKSLSNLADSAKKLDQQLTSVHETLFLEPNPCPAKWALKQMELIDSDMVRLPLLTLEPTTKAQVNDVLRKVGVLD